MLSALMYRSPEEYHMALSNYNLSVQREIAMVIAGCLVGKDFSDFAVFTTGSDARLERSFFSPLELVIYHKGPVSEIIKAIQEKCREIQPIIAPFDLTTRESDTIDFPGNLVQNIETKLANDPKIYSTEEGLISPGRILDRGYLFGNPKLYQEALNTLVEAIRKSKKRIKDYLRAQFIEYLGATISGIQERGQRRIVHIDFENDTANYEPLSGIAAFKYGPLRLIQTTITRSMTNAIKRGNLDVSELRRMKSPIMQRMIWLSTETKSKDIQELYGHYVFFLVQYHRLILGDNMDVEMDFNTNEIKKRSKRVAEICRDISGI